MAATAGNKGLKVRSDCFVNLTILDKGGIQIDLKSKVKLLYGKSILELCENILSFYQIQDAKLEIEDYGALPFVIAARLEAAVKQLINTKKEFLLPVENNTIFPSSENIQRRSRLYLPGNSPKLMLNAGIYKSDGIILDLEDSVSADKKKEAQLLVRNALRTIDFYDSETMVRINQLPLGLDDLKCIVNHKVNLILIPKTESAQEIIQVERTIQQILGKENTEIHFMPIIESAKGVINAFEIASASKNIVALAIGLEDYTADIQVQRTSEGTESFYARSAVVNAARAAGIQAIDSVFSDVDDLSELEKNVAKSRSLGFTGMGCIHPRQIPIINAGYNPTGNEIEKAMQIELAFEKANKAGLGVVSLGSKMIDAPIVKRAGNTIKNAIKTGILSSDWRTQHEQ